MINKNCCLILLINFLILLNGCNKKVEQKHTQIPTHISALKNLTVFPQNISATDTVKLFRENSFESNQDVFIDGYISKIAVDHKGRVFIVGQKSGTVAIYVFKSNGTFLTKFGRYGRGPGEFESIASIDVGNSKLYVLDSQLQKLVIFSLDDFSLISEDTIGRNIIRDEDKLPGIMKAQNLYALGNDTLLMNFQSRIFSNNFRNIPYYKVSEQGEILSKKILELERFNFYIPEKRQTSKGIFLPFTMPFSRNSLFAISNTGSMFTAWPEDFLIMEYDNQGNYLQAFYYPIKKVPLFLKDLDINNLRRQELRKHDLPDTWPALNTILSDDEGNLWVSTITESDSTFDWWVLNQNGELLAKFKWSGRKSLRDVFGNPYRIIKKGYF